MKCSTKHVGLDVHQATVVTSVRDEHGRILAQGVIPTEAGAIVEYFRGMRGTIHVAFEEGTQAQWLHDLLTPLVHRVVVCNRRGAKHQGNKGDQPDADELSDLLRCGRLRAVYHGGTDRATLKELARTYQNLVEDGTRVMQRLKALFRARGIRTPGRGVYAVDRQAAWLQQLPNDGVRFRARALYAELSVLQELRPEAKQAMLREARRDPAWRCCGRFRISAPCGWRCSWRRCRRRGGFGRSGTCGRTRGSRWWCTRRRSTSSMAGGRFAGGAARRRHVG